MKMSILGFNQATIVAINDTLRSQQRPTINANDIVFLDWFVYWFASSNRSKKQVTHDGQLYLWLRREYVRSQLPVLGLSDDSRVSRMLSRLVDMGLLSRVTRANDANKGKMSYYRPTEMVYQLQQEYSDTSTKTPEVVDNSPDHVSNSARGNADHVSDSARGTPLPRVKNDTSNTPSYDKPTNNNNKPAAHDYSDQSESSEKLPDDLRTITEIDLSTLDAWQRGFMQDLRGKLQSVPGYSLSEKQRKIFTSIVDKYAKAKKQENVNSWTCPVCGQSHYSHGSHGAATCAHCGCENASETNAEDALMYLLEAIQAPWFPAISPQVQRDHLATIKAVREQGSTLDFTPITTRFEVTA